MTQRISIDEAQTQEIISRIEAWAKDMDDRLVPEFVSRVNSEVAAVQNSTTGFEGSAADTYRAEFGEIAEAIKARVEGMFQEIAYTTLADQRERLTRTVSAFQELDTSMTF